MGKLNYSIQYRNGTNQLAPPRETFLEVRIYGNNLGIPKVRMYEELTSPPAYDVMTPTSGLPYPYFKSYGAFATGKRYYIDYIDDSIEVRLCVIAILNENPGEFQGCINYATKQEIISIQSINGGLSTNYLITESNNVNQISIDGGSTFRGNFTQVRYNGDQYSAYWSESELLALGMGGVIPSLIMKTGGCQIGQVGSFKFPQPVYPALSANYSATNSTASGANDGTITITVAGGSGSFTYAWSDGPVTKNRSGLSPGLYTIVITDTITGLTTSLVNIPITEPQPPPPLPVIGTILEPVPGNPIVFVPETLDAGTPQTLDNTLFCKQIHKGYQMGSYYNPYQKTDPLAFQFNGNFENYTLQMINKSSGEVTATYPLVLKQENVGVATDYAIRIQNDSIPGRSRIYSQTSNIVSLAQLVVGDVFEITNNIDGFNGLYSVVSIGDDYYVFTKNYAIPAAYSNATGRFISSTQDYNVYESTIDLLAVANGKYYFKLTGTSDNQKVLISEPIDVRVSHPATVGITYRNIDNSFGVVWTTGFTGFIRVPASFFKRLPGGERSVVRSADFKLVKINAKKKRVIALEIFYVPPYIIELLSLVFDCDYFAIDGVEFQTEEGMGEPEYTDRFYLANVVTNVEQVNWVSGYNGTDVGTISDGGFLMTEQGFLKR